MASSSVLPADGGSPSSSPAAFHSAPSSPHHLLHYFSAPSSPTHFLCSSSLPSPCPSPPPASSEFSFSTSLSPGPPEPPASADELFLDGRIRPTAPLRTRSVHRRARSMSPPRKPPPEDWPDADAPPSGSSSRCSSTSSSSSSASSSSSGSRSKRWAFWKDLLPSHRSRSEEHPPSLFSRRKGRSAAERHYAEKRAEAEEMRRRTFLPYRAGLLGCIGFSSRGYGRIARTWGAAVGSR